MNCKLFKTSWIYFFVLAIFSVGCVDDEFDSPTPIPVPDSNTTIAEVQAMFTAGEVIVTEDLVVRGAVISSDILGNIFKTMYIQDETGAIALRTEVGNTSVDFPFGSEVVVKLKDLTLSTFSGLKQIGFASVNLRDHVFRSQLSVPVVPLTKSISELTADDAPVLVQLSNVEFAEQGATFANPGGSSGENRTIQDCDGNTIIMRNSDFADNAADIVPSGNGSIVALLGRFNDTPQLLLNFEEDLMLDGTLCGSGTGTEVQMSIADLRALFTGSAAFAPDERKIKGIVISDRTNGTVTERNCIVQESGGSGIVVRFTSNHTLNLNDDVEIVVSGSEISEFQGLLQVNVDNARASVVGSGSIAPNVLTIQDILANFEDLESTLVQVASPTFSGNQVFNGNADVTDATGTMTLFTRGAADFSSQALPETADAITAIVTQGGGDETMQISVRNYEDLDNPMGGNTGGPAEIPFAESFDSGIPFNWVTIFTTGDRSWQGDDFDGVFFARMSAFGGSGNPIADVVTWLISPEFDFDAQSGEMLEIKIADAFRNGDPFSVVYSTDYTGSGDPTAATWTRIGESQVAALVNNPDSYDNMYESSGDIDLSGVVGTGYIGFIYNSMGGTVSTTIDISEVNLR